MKVEFVPFTEFRDKLNFIMEESDKYDVYFYVTLKCEMSINFVKSFISGVLTSRSWGFICNDSSKIISHYGNVVPIICDLYEICLERSLRPGGSAYHQAMVEFEHLKLTNTENQSGESD